MIDAFLTYINTQNLFLPDQKILLAVSGGIDSVVLCELFAKAKFNFGIAHCNFGLRGEESDADEVFVKKLSIKYKVPFHHITFQTADYAQNGGISIQMAARELRYNWFESLINDHSYAFLATAHHQNDSAETLLLNIAKGSGLAGLHGILPKRNKIIRPLLFAAKDDIYEYVVDNQLIWREDSSNDDIKYQRNKIRNEIVPIFKEINPDFETAVLRTMAKVSVAEEFLQKAVEDFVVKNEKKQGVETYLNVQEILLNSSKKYLLFEYLSKHGFNYLQQIAILESLGKEAGKRFLSPTVELVIDREQLVLIPLNNLASFMSKTIDIATLDENKSITFENLTLELLPVESIESLKVSPKIALLDFDKVGKQLTLRGTKEGDWFCPLGMNKKKSVADFLNDQKVPLTLKKHKQVLVSGLSICWIIGHRIDDRFKIGEKTERVLKVNMG